MDYIQGKPRSQIVLIESSLEEKIEQDNPVRIIDAFVNSCFQPGARSCLQSRSISFTIRRMTITSVRKAKSLLPQEPGINTIPTKPSSIKQNPARAALLKPSVRNQKKAG